MNVEKKVKSLEKRVANLEAQLSNIPEEGDFLVPLGTVVDTPLVITAVGNRSHVVAAGADYMLCDDVLWRHGAAGFNGAYKLRKVWGE